MTVTLSAQITGIWSLACVGALMVLQKVSAAKTLATVAADVSSLRGMSPHVYVKRGHATEALIAKCTVEGFAVV